MVCGVAIITMVHLPILALEGVEGKMFRPMALTVIFALTGSLLLSLTATPVLATFLLKPGMSEHDTLPIRWAKRLYEPILRRVLPHPVGVALAALAAFVLCIPVALQLGGEFIPQLDEGDLVIAQTRPPAPRLTRRSPTPPGWKRHFVRSSPARSAPWSAGSADPRSGSRPRG